MNSTPQNRSPWAKLIFNPDVFKDPVDIVDDKCVIGRAPACTLSLRDNKHVSAQHCQIEKAEDGRIYITDLSNNGTFINGTERVGKGKRRELTDGSVVFLVKKKGNAAQDVGFTVKLIKNQAVADQTIAYSPDIEILPPSPPPPGRSMGVTTRSSALTTQKSVGEPELKKFRPSPSVQDNSQSDATNVPSTSALAKKDQPAASETAGSSTRPKDGNSIADNLICSICFDIIHDCISLQPCMHCFCAGCYSDWMSRSEICPDCRVKVDQISKNHVLNNVINAYLEEHPDKKRSEEEIKDLDAKNKITAEMLKPKADKSKKKRAPAAAADDDDDDYHGSDCECSVCYPSSSSDESIDIAVGGNAIGLIQPAYHIPQCRMCVGYRGFPVLNARARPINPHTRLCPPGQAHIMCQCCFSNMPDRRQEANPGLPPITCAICNRAFCDLVFGCSRAGCVGCIARFKDIKFSVATYDTIINDNQFETNVLKNYMTKTRKNWDDVVKDCVDKLDRNEYQCPDKATYNLTSESPLCQICGLRNFRELAYQYRQNIPNADLPADVTRRSDCYWGKNCRTQKKFHHAAKHNHICEQTKFVP